MRGLDHLGDVVESAIGADGVVEDDNRGDIGVVAAWPSSDVEASCEKWTVVRKGLGARMPCLY